MFRFPAQSNRWQTQQKSDRTPDIVATKNINFDREGYVTLSNRTATVVDNNDLNSGNLGVGVAMLYESSGDFKLMTDDSAFDIDMSAADIDFEEDVSSANPSGTINSSGTIFNGAWVVSVTNDLHTWNGSAWTDRGVSSDLTSAVRHPLATFKNRNTLAVGNGPGVKQFDSAYSAATGPHLIIPSDFEVTSLGYNRYMLGVGTWVEDNGEAYFFVWDGSSTSANYGVPVGSNRIYFVAPYKSTFVMLTAKGQLLFWNGSGVEVLANLPVYYTTALLGDVDDQRDVCYDYSYYVDGDVILFNISARLASAGAEPYEYLPNMPSGVWCYDPSVGLYHRHGMSSAKLTSQTVSTADVNTTNYTVNIDGTDENSVIKYYAVGGAEIGGLDDHGVYYPVAAYQASAANADAALEFDTQSSLYNAAIAVDSTHVVNFWQGNAGDGFVQSFAIDTSTKTITTAAAALEFDTQDSSWHSVCLMDANHALLLRQGLSGDGFAQVFTINTTTWAVTTAAAALEFDTQDASYTSVLKIDSTHALAVWSGPGQDGFAQVLAVNTSTWAVTTAGASLEFDTNQATFISVAAIDSSNFLVYSLSHLSGSLQYHVLNVSTSYEVTTVNTLTGTKRADGGAIVVKAIDTGKFVVLRGDAASDGQAFIATVDSSYAVTESSTSLEFDTQNIAVPSVVVIDTSHFIIAWAGGASTVGSARSFIVDSANLINFDGSLLSFDTTNGTYNATVSLDSAYFVNFWQGSGSDGFTRVFEISTTQTVFNYGLTSGDLLEFDATLNQGNSALVIDSTHVINFWSGASNDGYAQSFAIDTATKIVTTAASALTFDANCLVVGACLMDANHALNLFYSNLTGAAQIFTVNTSTWAITTAAAALTFDTQTVSTLVAVKIDSTHALALWSDVDNDGKAQVLAVNTSTWAVTTAAALLEFDTQEGGSFGDISACLMDANHALTVWEGTGPTGVAQVLTINTTTWAVSTTAAPLVYDTQRGAGSRVAKIDSTHAIVVWAGGASSLNTAQVLAVNTSTWAVTTAAALFNFSGGSTSGGNYAIAQIDTNHFAVTFNSTDGYSVILEVNTSTWAVSTSFGPYRFDPDSASSNSLVAIDSNNYVNFHSAAGTDGFTAVLTVDTTSTTSGEIHLSDTPGGEPLALTSTGNSNQVMQVLSVNDFGQLDITHAGIVASAGDRNGDDMIFSEYAWAGALPGADMTDRDAFGVVLREFENRGYFVLSKALSGNVTDTWQKVIVKCKNIRTALDKVIVKTRSKYDGNMPIYSESEHQATWVTSTSFTTTLDLSNVAVGYEVEFTAGSGSGYLAHITALSNNAGTWTVTIDEAIPVAAGDLSRFAIDNWIKKRVISTDTPTAEDGYAEVSISDKSKELAVKIELRGFMVAVEEVQIINASEKISS